MASDSEAVLAHIGPGADLIVPLANGEPVVLLDAIEAHADELEVFGCIRCTSCTLAVDLLGQCASETVGGAYYSSSGGQADFARGAMYSPGGQGFVVLASTAKRDTISKIVAQLAPGDVVTTLKNTVDKVVTEWGVAELRGRSLRQRAEALIAVAHPAHRDRLRVEAVAVGHL